MTGKCSVKEQPRQLDNNSGTREVETKSFIHFQVHITFSRAFKFRLYVYSTTHHQFLPLPPIVVLQLIVA